MSRMSDVDYIMELRHAVETLLGEQEPSAEERQRFQRLLEVRPAFEPMKMRVDYDWSARKLAESPDDEQINIGRSIDLLSALRVASRELEQYVDLQQKLDYIEYAAGTQEKLDVVNAAIAKAEGKV